MAANQPKQPKLSKPFVWKAEEASAAAAQKTYFRVGPGGTKTPQNKGLVLLGADRTWKNNPSVVFLPGQHRLSGTAEDVASVLRSLQLSEADVSKALADAITIANHSVPEAQGGKKEVFDAEIRAHRDQKRVDLDLRDAINFARQQSRKQAETTDAAADGKAEEAPKAEGKTAKGGKSGKPAKGGKEKAAAKEKQPAVKSVHDMVAALSTENKAGGVDRVIDVTGYAKDSSKLRKVARSKAGKNKFGGPSLPLVSADLESFEQAISELNLDNGQDPKEEYRLDIEAFKRAQAAATVQAALPPPVTSMPAAPEPATASAAPAAPVSSTAAPVVTTVKAAPAPAPLVKPAPAAATATAAPAAPVTQTATNATATIAAPAVAKPSVVAPAKKTGKAVKSPPRTNLANRISSIGGSNAAPLPPLKKQ